MRGEQSLIGDRRAQPMPPVPPQPAGSRLLLSALSRRILVYLITAVLTIFAALTAVRLAAPPDPYGPVRVETLPGYSPGVSPEPTRVTYDATTGQTMLEVTQPDGGVRRFRVEKEGTTWRVYEDPQ